MPVGQIAETSGVPMARVVLAWVLKNPIITAPIVGATRPHHLVDAVEALISPSLTARSVNSNSPTGHTRQAPSDETVSLDRLVVSLELLNVWTGRAKDLEVVVLRTT